MERTIAEEKMGDLVNLNRARKSRDKKAAEHRAEENRLRFGRSKTERDFEAAKIKQASTRLDQHKLTPGKDS